MPRASPLLPTEKASGEAALAQARVDLATPLVRAGVAGRVEQFALRIGDVVNPLMRPAGILIPEGAGRRGLQAGVRQIEAQGMKEGMGGGGACRPPAPGVIPQVGPAGSRPISPPPICRTPHT